MDLIKFLMMAQETPCFAELHRVSPASSHKKGAQSDIGIVFCDMNAREYKNIGIIMTAIAILNSRFIKDSL